MKKILQLLSSLILVTMLFSCDVFGGTENNENNDNGGDNETPTALVSDWWIKGSFDNWASDEADRHYFIKDELNNNKLSFEITDLFAIGYEFVIVNGDGTEYKAPVDGDTFAADDTAITFVTEDYTNALFTAAKTSYVVNVDVTDPEAPVVTLTAGTVDATLPGFDDLADRLLIKGDAFTIGWNITEGVKDADAKTVTFDDLTVDSKTGGFGFESMYGYLKGDTVESPTEAGASADAQFITTDGAGNITINNSPNSDAVYTVVVTIDADAEEAEMYSMVVTLKSEGSVAWAFEAPTEVLIVGGEFLIEGWSDWSETDDGRVSLTITDDVAEFTFTLTDTCWPKFKYVEEANSGWNNLKGWGAAEVTASPEAPELEVSDSNGNFQFNAPAAGSYTIKIDYSDATDYASTGKPLLTVVQN